MKLVFQAQIVVRVIVGGLLNLSPPSLHFCCGGQIIVWHSVHHAASCALCVAVVKKLVKTQDDFLQRATFSHISSVHDILLFNVKSNMFTPPATEGALDVASTHARNSSLSNRFSKFFGPVPGTSQSIIRAQHKYDGGEYAIKCVPVVSNADDASGDAIGSEPTLTGRNDSVREITVLSRLKHSNIIRYFQSWHDQRNPYFYIQLEACVSTLRAAIDDGRLRAHSTSAEGESSLSQSSGLRNSRSGLVWRMFQQMCDAVAYLHDDEGIAHCALRPDNVLLTKNLDVKIGNFDEFQYLRPLNSKVPLPSIEEWPPLAGCEPGQLASDNGSVVGLFAAPELGRFHVANAEASTDTRADDANAAPDSIDPESKDKKPLRPSNLVLYTPILSPTLSALPLDGDASTPSQADKMEPLSLDSPADASEASGNNGTNALDSTSSPSPHTHRRIASSHGNNTIIATGETHTGCVDIFSLGVIFLELWVGSFNLELGVHAASNLVKAVMAVESAVVNEVSSNTDANADLNDTSRIDNDKTSAAVKTTIPAAPEHFLTPDRARAYPTLVKWFGHPSPTSTDHANGTTATKSPPTDHADDSAQIVLPNKAQLICRWLIRHNPHQRPEARAILNEQSLFPPVINLDPQLYNEALRIIRDTPPARQKLLEALVARPIDPGTDFTFDLPRSSLDALLMAEGKKPLLHRKAAGPAISAPEASLLHTRLSDLFVASFERFGAFRQMLPQLIPRVTDDRHPAMANGGDTDPGGFNADSIDVGLADDAVVGEGRSVAAQLRDTLAVDRSSAFASSERDPLWFDAECGDRVNDATAAAIQRHYDNLFSSASNEHDDASGEGSGEDDDHVSEPMTLASICASVMMEPVRPQGLKRPVVLLTADDVKVQLPTRSCESFAWFLARALTPGTAPSASASLQQRMETSPISRGSSDSMRLSQFKRYDISRVFQSRPAGPQETWEVSFDWMWSFSRPDNLKVNTEESGDDSEHSNGDGWDSDAEELADLDDSDEGGAEIPIFKQRTNTVGLSITVETLVLASRLLDEMVCAQFPGLSNYVHFTLSINHADLAHTLMEACGFEPCFHSAVRKAISRYVRGVGPRVTDRVRTHTHQNSSTNASASDENDRAFAEKDVEELHAAVDALPLQEFDSLHAKVKSSNTLWDAHEDHLVGLGCPPQALALLRIFTVQVKPSKSATSSLCALLDLFEVVSEKFARHLQVRPSTFPSGDPGNGAARVGQDDLDVELMVAKKWRQATRMRRLARHGTDLVQYLEAVIRSYHISTAEMSPPTATTHESAHWQADTGPHGSVFLRFDPGLDKSPQYDTGIVFEIHACALPVSVPSSTNTRSLRQQAKSETSHDTASRMKWSLCTLIAEGGRYDNLVRTFCSYTRSSASSASQGQATPFGLLPLSANNSHRSAGSAGAPHHTATPHTGTSTSRRSAASNFFASVGAMDDRHVIGITFALTDLAEFVRVIDQRAGPQSSSKFHARSLRELVMVSQPAFTVLSQMSKTQTAVSASALGVSSAASLSASTGTEYTAVKGPTLRGIRGTVLVCCDTGHVTDAVTYRLRIARALWTVGIQAEVMHPDHAHLREYDEATRVSSHGHRSSAMSFASSSRMLDGSPSKVHHHDALSWLIAWCRSSCISQLAIVRGTVTGRHSRYSYRDWSTNRTTEASQYHIKLIRLTSPDGTPSEAPQMTMVKTITELVQLSRTYFLEERRSREQKLGQRHWQPGVSSSMPKPLKMSDVPTASISNFPSDGAASTNPWDNAVFVRIRGLGKAQHGRYRSGHLHKGPGISGGLKLSAGKISSLSTPSSPPSMADFTGQVKNLSSTDKGRKGSEVERQSDDDFAVLVSGVSEALSLSGEAAAPAYLKVIALLDPHVARLAQDVELRAVASEVADKLDGSRTISALVKSLQKNQTLPFAAADAQARSVHVIACGGGVSILGARSVGTAYMLKQSSVRMPNFGGNISNAHHHGSSLSQKSEPSGHNAGAASPGDGGASSSGGHSGGGGGGGTGGSGGNSNHTQNGSRDPEAILNGALQILRRLQAPLNFLRDRVTKTGKTNVLDAGGANLLETPATFVLVYSLADHQFDVVVL